MSRSSAFFHQNNAEQQPAISASLAFLNSQLNCMCQPHFICLCLLAVQCSCTYRTHALSLLHHSVSKAFQAFFFADSHPRLQNERLCLPNHSSTAKTRSYDSGNRTGLCGVVYLFFERLGTNSRDGIKPTIPAIPSEKLAKKTPPTFSFPKISIKADQNVDYIPPRPHAYSKLAAMLTATISSQHLFVNRYFHFDFVSKKCKSFLPTTNFTHDSCSSYIQHRLDEMQLLRLEWSWMSTNFYHHHYSIALSIVALTQSRSS